MDNRSVIIWQSGLGQQRLIRHPKQQPRVEVLEWNPTTHENEWRIADYNEATGILFQATRQATT